MKIAEKFVAYLSFKSLAFMDLKIIEKILRGIFKLRLIFKLCIFKAKILY